MRKHLWRLALGAIGVFVVVCGVLVYLRGFQRMRLAVTLFHGAEQHEAFSHATEMFPVSTMRAAPQPYRFPVGAPITLPRSFTYKHIDYDTRAHFINASAG